MVNDKKKKRIPKAKTPSVQKPAADAPPPLINPNQEEGKWSPINPEFHKWIWRSPERESQFAGWIANDARDYVSNYHLTPKFQERLDNAWRGLGVISPGFVHRHTEGARSTPYEHLPEVMAADTKGASYAIDNRRYGDGSNYSEAHHIQLRPNKDKLDTADYGQFKTILQAAAPHEFAHSSSGFHAELSGPKNLTIPEAQQREIARRSVDPKAYGAIPEETRGDLMAARYALHRLGIYDAGTEDFTPQHLERFIQTLRQNGTPNAALERLLKTFGAENVIWLMNNIAQQGGSAIPDNAV